MYKKRWQKLTQHVVGGPDPGGFEAEAEHIVVQV